MLYQIWRIYAIAVTGFLFFAAHTQNSLTLQTFALAAALVSGRSLCPCP